jgi:hypothetical protein
MYMASALAGVQVTAAKRGPRQQQEQAVLRIRCYLMMNWLHTSVILIILRWQRRGWR